MSSGAPALLMIMGPTASGKTGLAVQLAERFCFQIISVDSAMVYRQMDIGTAKPGPDVLARAPHRLIDIVDPAQAYSAARFREDALREIEQILASGDIPLLVGGTMLYFHALQQGLSAMPGADPQVRAELLEEAGRVGWSSMHRQLRRLDPESAARIHPNDPQRIQRALEIYRLTGRTRSELWVAAGREALPYDAVRLALAPSQRSVLHANIERRFEQMLELGFEAEVEALRARGDLDADMPAMRAVGYRQVWEYLDGDTGPEQMRHRAVVATRRFAKRQLTWLRGQEDCQWLDSDPPGLLDRSINVLEACGLTLRR